MENQPKKAVSKGLIIGICAVVLAIVFAILCVTHVICLKHDWQPATCTEPSICSKCGRTQGEALGHSPETDAAIAPTCTETGLTEGSHCSVCGEVLTAQEVIPANGHTLVVDDATLPTCTETALTEGSHCSVCGEVLTAQETIEALGHKPETDAAVAPTCTETGLTEGSHCSVCGEVLTAQEVIPATGHSFTEATYLEPEICSVCGAQGADALGNDLFTRLFKTDSSEKAVSVSVPASGTMKITANIAGEGMEEIASAFNGSSLTIRFNGDTDSMAADVTLGQGTPFTAIVTEKEGSLYFALPGIDENVYKMGPALLAQLLESAGTAGETEVTVDSDFFNRATIALREIGNKLAPHLKTITGVINADTVTDAPGEYTLSVLGETVSCRVLRCKPTADDWEKVLNTIIGSIAGDDELKQYILTLAQPLVDLGLVPDFAGYYDYAMMGLSLFGGQVAGYLDGAELEMAYEGDRVYAMRLTYQGTGFGVESIGSAETGRHDVFVMYSAADPYIIAEHTLSGADGNYKGTFVSPDFELSCDYALTSENPGELLLSANATFNGSTFSLSEAVTADKMTGCFKADIDGITEEVNTELTVGPTEIVLPEYPEVEVTDTDALEAVTDKIYDELYNAEVFGHDWQDASCVTPRTCRICGATEGEALGHTPGEWSVTTEATVTAAGEESLFCSECGAVIETRAYELSPEEILAISLLGCWDTTLDWSDHADSLLVSYLFKDDADAAPSTDLPEAELPFRLELHEDGTFTYGPSAGFSEALAAYFKSAIPEAVRTYVTYICGITGTTIDGLYASYGVRDLPGLMQALGVDKLYSDDYINGILEGATITGTYTIVDGSIVFTTDGEVSEPFSLEDGILTLSGNPDGSSAFVTTDGTVAANYPSTFTKAE